MSQADTYYIKAMDYYPFGMEEVMENLNYALSIDSDHFDALYMMGMMHFDQFKNFDKAEHYFKLALTVNKYHFDCCYAYAKLMMQRNRIEEAEKTVRFMEKCPDRDLAVIFHFKSYIHEYKKEYREAINSCNQALMECYNSSYGYSITEDLDGIKQKLKRVKKALKISKELCTDWT